LKDICNSKWRENIKLEMKEALYYRNKMLAYIYIVADDEFGEIDNICYDDLAKIVDKLKARKNMVKQRYKLYRYILEYSSNI